MMLTFSSKMTIWNEILSSLSQEKTLVLFTAGMLYEEIAPFVMASTQFLENKPVVKSYKNSWTATFENFRIEIYDLGDSEHVNLVLERHVMSPVIVGKVLTYEIESNTLVWSVYETELHQLFEAKEYLVPIYRNIING
jgi:hypothetical protein